MPRVHSVRLLPVLFVVVVSAFGAKSLRAQVTHVVGTCLGGTSFTTINDALLASPFPDVVEVCPGTYKEQVFIQNPVTLKGITSGDSDQVIIMPPSGGLFVNADADFGKSVAAQVLVVVGPVEISNLIVDGTGNNFSESGHIMAGIFFENSSGTVTGVTTRNQEGNANGVGILLEGGSLTPSVTVERSSIHDFDLAGIWTETNSTSPELTATIKGNFASTTSKFIVPAFKFDSGSTVTATNNLVNNVTGLGFVFNGAEGKVSGNNVVGGIGVNVNTDAAISIVSNKFSQVGVATVFFVSTTLTQFQKNLIVQSGTGIKFGCYSFNSAAIHSNTIIDTGIGIQYYPGTYPATTYFDVGTERANNCK